MGNRTAAGVTTGGSFTQQEYDFNAANQVVGWDYDAAGNLIDDNAQTYTFDDRGRMMSAGVATYAYNGDGVLAQATQNGATTSYVQDTQAGLSQILAMTTNGSTTNAFYGHQRLATLTNGAYTWQFHDRLGSVGNPLGPELDHSGAATARPTYDPWGEPTSPLASAFGFTGELQNTDTGLINLRARWYQPGSGTLLGRDPFSGYPDMPYSLHPYQYAYSQPTLFTDKSGCMVDECHQMIEDIKDMAAVSRISPVADMIFCYVDLISPGFGWGTEFSDRILERYVGIESFIGSFYGHIRFLSPTVMIGIIGTVHMMGGTSERHNFVITRNINGTPTDILVSAGETVKVTTPNGGGIEIDCIQHPTHELCPTPSEINNYGFKPEYWSNSHHFFAFYYLGFISSFETLAKEISILYENMSSSGNEFDIYAGIRGVELGHDLAESTSDGLALYDFEMRNHIKALEDELCLN